jgi:hypothetical protein
MIELTNTPLYDIFMDNCQNVETIIRLCTPFIKTDIVEAVLSRRNENTSINLITNVNLRSYCKKASDISSLQRLIDQNSNVYTYSSLHAKFYIFDTRLAIITSANLTSSGLKRNWEYGILTDDPGLVASAINDFESLRLDELTGKIRQDHLDTIDSILKTIPPTPKVLMPSLDLDFSPEDNIYYDDIKAITANLSGWKKAVFDEITNLGKVEFTADDCRVMVEKLHILFPHNNFVAAKIRQQLQFLRDLGLLQFVTKGVYKRLWV